MKKVNKRRIKRNKKIAENLTVCAFIFVFIGSIFAISFHTHEAFASTNELKNAETIIYVVKKGDTLWSISNKTGFENVDTRVIVDRIQQLNNLDSTVIYSGDILIIPKK